jgi:K+-sensing histidine kinase KdpD
LGVLAVEYVIFIVFGVHDYQRFMATVYSILIDLAILIVVNATGLVIEYTFALYIAIASILYPFVAPVLFFAGYPASMIYTFLVITLIAVAVMGAIIDLRYRKQRDQHREALERKAKH